MTLPVASATAFAPAKRKRRRWKHLFWGVPLLFATGVAVRVATYPLPVLSLAPPAGSGPALAGALHVHSTASDGRGTIEEIARDASDAGLSFVVLTDHNVAPRAPERHHGVLVLSGTEVTTRDGHLLALDFLGTPPPAGTPAHHAVPRIRQAGGFTAVAHGDDTKAPWRRWDLERVTGLELYNAGADARRNLRFPYGTLLGAVLAYPLNPDYALLVLHERPHRELARFDSLARARNVIGFCGLDAHGFPSYGRLFRAVRTYVLAQLGGDELRDARAVWDALRHGRHHCSFDLFADGSRFRFHAVAGPTRVPMGASVPVGAAVRFVADVGVDTGRAAEITLLRNGSVAARARGSRLEHVTRDPGAYRVEVSLPVPNLFGGTRRETWILSNPIFVRDG